MLPDTYASTPNANPIIAEVPVASPSIPSVIFAPLETAVIIKITMGIKIQKAYCS